MKAALINYKQITISFPREWKTSLVTPFMSFNRLAGVLNPSAVFVHKHGMKKQPGLPFISMWHTHTLWSTGAVGLGKTKPFKKVEPCLTFAEMQSDVIWQCNSLANQICATHSWCIILFTWRAALFIIQCHRGYNCCCDNFPELFISFSQYIPLCRVLLNLQTHWPVIQIGLYCISWCYRFQKQINVVWHFHLYKTLSD